MHGVKRFEPLKEPLSSWPNINIEKKQKITKEDNEELKSYWDRFNDLQEKHYHLEHLYNISKFQNYLDENIEQQCGIEAYYASKSLYNDWLDLRRDLESFQAKKMLPETYPEHYWRRPLIGNEASSWYYAGDYIVERFDSGPAQWCINSLMGISCDLKSREHIQTIECYTKCGLIIGVVSLILGVFSCLL